MKERAANQAPRLSTINKRSPQIHNLLPNHRCTQTFSHRTK